MTAYDEPSSRADRDPMNVAPTAGRAWAEAFIIEQRLLGVPGDRIGDALVTVESHLRDSGETAADAFGDPRAYARSVAGGERTPVLGAGLVGHVVMGLVGMLLVNRAAVAWATRTEITLTVGDLIVAVILSVAVAVVLMAATRVLRFAVEHRVLAALTPLLLIIPMVVALLVAREPLAVVAPAPLLIVGVVLLIASSIVAWRSYSDDAVRAPGSPARPGWRGRLFMAAIMPAMTLLLLTSDLVIRLAG